MFSADAADSNTANASQNDQSKKTQPLLYKALVRLKDMALAMDGQRFALSAGMQTDGEIWLGDRTVMEYLLSPVRKAWHEAAVNGKRIYLPRCACRLARLASPIRDHGALD